MSLSVDYDSLRSDVGRFLGYGRNPDAWSTDQAADVDESLRNGLRQFYFPLVPAPEGAPGRQHVWSFLRPVRTLATSSGTSVYELPADYEEFEGGEFTFSAGSEHQSVMRVTDAKLRSERARDNRSGPPKYFSVRTKTQNAGEAERYEVEFYPTPDDAYTLSYRYVIEPPSLSASNTIPLGGSLHSETIRQSCLAAAELLLDDSSGAHTERFVASLSRSIDADKQFEQRIAEQEIWPFENEPQGLTVNRAYLERMIGRTMGHGPSPGGWNRTQHEEIKEALRQGLRQFYRPPVLPGERYPHDWSFLRPVKTLTTVSGESTYDLPDGFADFMGPMTYAAGSNELYPSVSETTEFDVRQSLQNTSATGRPYKVAKRPKPLSETTGETRYEVLLYPLPDAAYELTYRCSLNPELLLSESSFPYGGQPHAQTVLESCLAIAESLAGRKQREHRDRFLMCLQSSVGHDRMVDSPDGMGCDREWDSPLVTSDFRHDLSASVVTYNGQVV